MPPMRAIYSRNLLVILPRIGFKSLRKSKVQNVCLIIFSVADIQINLLFEGNTVFYSGTTNLFL